MSEVQDDAPRPLHWLLAMRRRGRIKAAILVPFVAVLAFAVGILAATAYSYEVRARQHELAEITYAVERLFRLQIDNDAAKLHATLCPISRDSSLKTAFLEGNRETLMMQAKPLFKQLRDQHGVTHFYFLNASREVILRVHKPEMHGDVINRATMLRAVESASETQGLELGPLGTLTLRAVKPWYQDGRLIGYLELGEEVGHISRALHEALGVNLLVRVYSRMLPNTLRRGGSSSQAPVVVHMTTENAPSAISQDFWPEEGSSRLPTQLVSGGRSLYMARLPLTDAADHPIGDLLIIRDVTALQRIFRGRVAIAVTLTLLAGALVFWVFYRILDRVEADYRRQREIETRLTRLNTDHRRIVQMAKLSEVGQTIGEVAHQLNNPLVGVINTTQLAERVAEDPARVRQLLAEIRRAGADCHAFLKRMLTFTRVSSAERKPTDAVVLIRDTVALFQQSNDQHPQVTLSLPEPPAILDVDPVLIRHALFALLTNAQEANGPGGRIDVELQKADGVHGTPGWRIAVGDEGPGVSEALREKVFTPFFTTRPDGTGLGLTIVQHIAALHEGEVTCANRVGGGAVFALWIPLHQTQPGTKM